jgi:hypothetical protein
VAVVISDAEADASAIRGTFDSIQPPESRADRLRVELDRLLSEAVSTISNLRIAARRDDITGLLDAAGPLRDLSHRLELFVEAHR